MAPRIERWLTSCVCGFLLEVRIFPGRLFVQYFPRHPEPDQRSLKRCPRCHGDLPILTRREFTEAIAAAWG